MTMLTVRMNVSRINARIYLSECSSCAGASGSVALSKGTISCKGKRGSRSKFYLDLL